MVRNLRWKPKQIWPVRIRLQLAEKQLDLALFNLAVDRKLIPFGKTGYVARFVRTPGDDQIVVPAIRHQRRDDYH